MAGEKRCSRLLVSDRKGVHSVLIQSVRRGGFLEGTG